MLLPLTSYKTIAGLALHLCCTSKIEKAFERLLLGSFLLRAIPLSAPWRCGTTAKCQGASAHCLRLPR